MTDGFDDENTRNDEPNARPGTRPAASEPPGGEPLTSNVTDTALVFEGGGMRAALTSAVAVTLLKAGIHFDWVGGVSAGASNTANYLIRDARRARRCFVDFAADPQLGDWRTFIRGQGLFNAQYIYQGTGLPDQALPFDWETFVRNPARMRIAAFDAETGETAVWSQADTPTMSDLMIRVQASSTMPVIMPPVRIGENVYVDGALGTDGGIPVSMARADGYEKFFFVLTRPRDYVKKPVRFDRVFRPYFRKYPAMADALFSRWERYNRTHEEVLELEKADKAYVFAPEVMPVENSERDVAKLAAAHRLGLSQARRELPAMLEFLGMERG